MHPPSVHTPGLGLVSMWITECGVLVHGVHISSFKAKTKQKIFSIQIRIDP